MDFEVFGHISSLDLHSVLYSPFYLDFTQISPPLFASAAGHNGFQYIHYAALGRHNGHFAPSGCFEGQISNSIKRFFSLPAFSTAHVNDTKIIVITRVITNGEKSYYRSAKSSLITLLSNSFSGVPSMTGICSSYMLNIAICSSYMIRCATSFYLFLEKNKRCSYRCAVPNKV